MPTHTHTQGPWEIDELLDSEHAADCMLRGDWIAVADTDPNGGHVAYCHALNANLIAAAPELLTALEKVVEYAADCAAENNERPVCIAAARAIIAKVTE